MPYITQSQIRTLKEVLRSAKMKTMRVHDPDGNGPFDPTAKDFTRRVKEATRLYRQTWIISPLESLIGELESK